MEILITGGAGYIGSHLAKQLIENTDYNLVIFDNLSTGSQFTIDTLQQIAANLGKQEITFYHTDLNDLTKIEQIFSLHSFNAIFHFAASIVVSESVDNPLKYYLNNTINTTFLIQIAIKYGVKNFIFSSTAAVYGESNIDLPITETMPVNPINPYGTSKLMSEKVLQDAASVNPDFNYIILRYFNVAGASMDNLIGQSFPNATHLIKIAAECAAKKRNMMHIYGTDYPTKDGTCIRDFIHIEDLASAHLAALEYLKQNHKSNTFNCGYGQGYSVKEVIKTMKNISGIDFQVDITSRRSGDPAQLIANNTKILNTLSWQPKYNDLSLICKTALAWEEKIK